MATRTTAIKTMATSTDWTYCVLTLVITLCYTQAQTNVLMGTLTQYDVYDVTARSVLLPDPGDVVSVAGVLTAWSAYLGGGREDARVRLQLWRPLLVPPDDVTGRNVSVQTPFVAELVGQTDYRALKAYGHGLHTFPLEPHERLRLESGDILGLQWDAGNPVPYFRGVQCAGAGGGARIMDVYSSLDLSPGREDPYRRFRVLEEGRCRAYSVQITVTPAACRPLVVTSTAQSLQGTARAAEGWSDRCWVVRPSDVTTVVQVNVMEIDVTVSCDVSQDYLHVRSGPTSTFPLLATFCEKVSPSADTSRLYKGPPGGALYIRFVAAPEGRNDKHFRLTYRGVEGQLVPGQGVNCTVLVVDEAGTSISSPNYPQPYPTDSARCWVVHTSRSTSRVVLDVEDSDLAPWTEDPGTQAVVCPDLVTVYDGPRRSSPVLREWCGNQQPREVASAGSGVLIWFSSDAAQNQHRGFKLNIMAEEKAPLACTLLTANGTERFVQSHGYPLEYPPQWEACWVVTAPRRVKVTIHDSHLETSDTCSYDYLDVRDGAEAHSALLRRSCDPETGSDVISSGPQVYIHFRSDGSVQGPGFRLGYSATHSENCAIHSAYSYFLDLQSPGYNDQLSYPPDTDVCWTLVAPSDGEQVKVEVVSFQLQDSPGCTKDAVRFYDGDLRAPTLGRWCGNTSDGALLGTGRTLTVRLSTDGDQQGRGFRLTYVALPKHRCKSVYASASEWSLTSTSYPTPYSPSTNACWLIEAASGHDVIQIDVTDVNMDGPSVGSKACNRDAINIRDGNSGSANVLTEVCGEDVPNRSITTSGRFALVTFTSDSQGQGRGFRLLYKSKQEDRCQPVEVQRTMGALTSPGYPVVYAPQGLVCWTLRAASPTSTVRLVVDDLHLAADCRDYVDVIDGDSVDDVRLRRWCGGKLPDDVTSSGSVLSVRFVSDGQRQGRGFRLSYWQEPDHAPLTTSSSPLTTSSSPLTTSSSPLTTSSSPLTTSQTPMVSSSTHVVTSPSSSGVNSPAEEPPSSTLTTQVSTTLNRTTTSQINPDPTSKLLTTRKRPLSSECIRHVAPRIYWDIISARTFPYDRTGGMDRCWVLTTKDDAEATLSVKLLNMHISSSHCRDRTQYLELRDGHSSSAPLILSLCGSNVPNQQFVTTGPAAFIRFSVRTNHSYFNLRYSQIPSDKKTTIVPSGVQSEDSSFDSIVIGLSIGTIATLLILVFIGLCVYKRRHKPFIYTDVINLSDEALPTVHARDSVSHNTRLHDSYGGTGKPRMLGPMLATLQEVDRESSSTISNDDMFSMDGTANKMAAERVQKRPGIGWMKDLNASPAPSVAGGSTSRRDIIIMGAGNPSVTGGRNPGGGRKGTGVINRGYVVGGDRQHDDKYTPAANERMIY